MLGRVRGRLSFANVVSVVALFVALGGGAYAASLAPSNSVNSAAIINGEVKPTDIADGGVLGIDVRNATLTGTDVAANSLTGADVAEDTLGEVPQAFSADFAQSAEDADALGGSPASAYLRSDRVTQIDFDAGPCLQTTDAGCTTQITFGQNPNMTLTATCEDKGATPKLWVSVGAASGENRTVNYNAISGTTASQGGFGSSAGTIILIENDQQAQVGTIVIRTKPFNAAAAASIVTIDYHAYAANSPNGPSYCQLAGNALRT